MATTPTGSGNTASGGTSRAAAASTTTAAAADSAPTTSAASEPVADVQGGGVPQEPKGYGEVYVEEVTVARSKTGTDEPTEAEKALKEENRLRAENPNKVVYRRVGGKAEEAKGEDSSKG